jgi:hypothetical protein
MSEQVFRIYTRVNLADTCRDPDEYVYKEVAYVKGDQATKKRCREYIKEHFFRKDSDIIVTKNGYEAMDFCSYPTHLFAERITVE